MQTILKSHSKAGTLFSLIIVDGEDPHILVSGSYLGFNDQTNMVEHKQLNQLYPLNVEGAFDTADYVFNEYVQITDDNYNYLICNN